MVGFTYNYKELLLEHYKDCWETKPNEYTLIKGPMNKTNSNFSVLEFPVSNSRKMWTYATSCMSSFDDENPVELHLFSPIKHNIHIETLTAVAFYHLTDKKLWLNHTVNFGRPWLENSICNHGLISLPYLDGNSLECFHARNKTIKIFWLIPISISEVEYKKENGVDALEELFEQKQFNYLDPKRISVI